QVAEGAHQAHQRPDAREEPGDRHPDDEGARTALRQAPDPAERHEGVEERAGEDPGGLAEALVADPDAEDPQVVGGPDELETDDDEAEDDAGEGEHPGRHRRQEGDRRVGPDPGGHPGQPALADPRDGEPEDERGGDDRRHPRARDPLVARARPHRQRASVRAPPGDSPPRRARKRFEDVSFTKDSIARCPRTLLPASSSGGEKVAIPNWPGTTAMMPPPTPLLAGTPTR